MKIILYLLFNVFFYLSILLNSQAKRNGVYLIGTGIADVTGPAAEVNMMGYGKLKQDSSGIHFRLFSRAFTFEDSYGKRVCFVSVDACMIDQIVKTEVIRKLKLQFGDIYSTENVLLSGIHTHSGPGGFLQYLLYTITAQGFNWQSFNALVDGIILSIERAHQNMNKGYIYYNRGMLLNASVNRSPTAYVNNSIDERRQYQYDTDKDMHILKLTDLDHKPIGLITWFAVHPTSMNNTNLLISGDNKGYASILFEQSMNSGKLPGRGPFVAAFASTNLGDVSPNIRGPHCIDTGEPCSELSSTCNGKSNNCIALGPGKDMFDSTRIIGERQYLKAKELFDNATKIVTGPIDFIHQHIDMSSQKILLHDGSIVSTCIPAMGYSFAAGTTDGPGAFDFKQGATTPNAFWNLVRDFISKPSKEMIECHKPKPILLATGQMKFPYDWQPSILPTQIFKIGGIVIIGVPAEFTTMAGRRLRSAVKNVFEKTNSINDIDSSGDSSLSVIIAGLSNAYSSYVTTYEEYQIQRYEGASTAYGPHTLNAYIQQYVKLANSLVNKVSLPSGPDPPDLLSKQFSLRPGVIFDSAPLGKKFGDCVLQPEDSYGPGSTVEVKFISGHPQNDLMTEKTFLTVEKMVNSTQFAIIATDTNLETKFFWKRTNLILGHSEVTITWDIPLDITSGSYRIRHFGAYRSIFQKLYFYSGQTNLFKVESHL